MRTSCCSTWIKRGMALVWAGGVAVLTSCNFTPQPNVIIGPSVQGNEPPTLEIINPVADLSVGQGQSLLLRWVDSDPDSAATIMFKLINTTTNQEVTLVQDIPENDDEGPDQYTVSTSLVPQGKYNLAGVISDRTSSSQVFALTPPPNSRRVVITVTASGEQPPTRPPQVAMLLPQFDQSVAEEDTLLIAVAPTALGNLSTVPFDADSDPTLYIVLDTDEIPDNDDPANPDSSIIVLDQRNLTSADSGVIVIAVTVRLSQIPPRVDGKPYFIRATITDQVNPPVHDYADGTISVVRLASGLVDLYDVGRVTSGSRFYGFTPGSRLGHRITGLTDFDADGADDFLMAAQFANPRGAGQAGEAYLIYGFSGLRFGGTYPANGTAEAVRGCIFEGTPVRDDRLPRAGRTEGITDVNFLPDVTGDGRPELLVGLAHVDGAFQGMDFDPSDALVTGTSAVQVTVEIRQGRVTETVDNNTRVVDNAFDGVEDTVISSCRGSGCRLGTQSDELGQLTELYWNEASAQDIQWSLLKFKGIVELLNQLGDRPGNLDIPEVQATLRLNVFRTGDNGLMYQAFTYFDEDTTYATFAKGGGDPQPGVDYSVTGAGGNQALLGTINADDTGPVNIDVSTMVQQLLQGTLRGSNQGDGPNDPLVNINELRFLIDAQGQFSTSPDPAAIRSSEFNINAALRPTLILTYTRTRTSSAVCYPDRHVNNWTDAPPAGPTNDDYFHYGGMVTFINSENRDSSGPVDPERLWDTAVTLELVGQEPNVVLSGGFTQRASGATPGRIDGCRFVAGFYDYIDPFRLNQPVRDDAFGYNVAWLPDMNLDGRAEIIISAPTNEKYIKTLEDEYSAFVSTQLVSTRFFGSLTILPGQDYGTNESWQDDAANANVPVRVNGSCNPNGVERALVIPVDTYDIFAEDVEDFLHDGQYAGDINLDGVPDILAGAPLNNRGSLADTGAVYVIQGKNFLGEVDLGDADDSRSRHPMIRIRGTRQGDRIGWTQAGNMDINGDRLDDIIFGSPFADFGVPRTQSCGADINGDGFIDEQDFVLANFTFCQNSVGTEVFANDACKVYDFNNDSVIDQLDRDVFDCLAGGGTTCCENTVDNGFIGVVFGGITLDGDFDLSQVATTDLPGVIFYGTKSLDRAGADVASAGDFNRDGFGDILIAAPGESRIDTSGRTRRGVVYLIFGGPHLYNRIFSLDEVGTSRLPGVVFISPYLVGRPNEAPPETVAGIGDINSDGYDDIAIGIPRADFINLNFPQGPNASNEDAAVGRRRNTGDVFIIYGNNFGSNRRP